MRSVVLRKLASVLTAVKPRPSRKPPRRAAKPLELSSLIMTPAVALCSEVTVVSTPDSIDFTNFFQSESEGTCQPVGQMFLVDVPLFVIMPLAAYPLYRYPYIARFPVVGVLSCA